VLEPFLNPAQVEDLRPLHAVSSLGFGLLALTASLFHLGRPQFAFRAVLGLRHSWLSREIVAFGLFAGLAVAYATGVIFQQSLSDSLPVLGHVNWVKWLGWSVAMSGVIAVFCSTMIYVFTNRECWSMTRVGVRFVLTSALLGVATVWLSMLVAMLVRPSAALSDLLRETGPLLCQTLIGLTAVKLIWEASIFRHLLLRRMTPLQRSALLLSHELSNTTMARFALGMLGGLLMPALLSRRAGAISNSAELVQFAATAGLLFIACLAGELLERYLFFAACAAPRMPGGIR
jgi:DMSO reductase anchor subunit